MLGNLWLLVLYWFCVSLFLWVLHVHSHPHYLTIWFDCYNIIRSVVLREFLQDWQDDDFWVQASMPLFLIQLSKCKNWSFFRCRYCLILLDIFLSFENYSRCMSFILTLLYYWASSTQLIRGDLFDFCFLYVPCYAHNNYDTSNYIYFPLLSVS